MLIWPTTLTAFSKTLPVNNMNNNVSIIVISVIVLIVLGVAGYFGYKALYKSEQQA